MLDYLKKKKVKKKVDKKQKFLTNKKKPNGLQIYIHKLGHK